LSSQFLSGLALAAKARGDVQLILPEERVSSGYFKMTQDMISNFSELSQRGERCFSIPADASGATFFLVALCLHGGELVFEREWSDEHPEASVGRWLVGEGLLEAEGTMWKSTGKVPERALSLNIDAFPDAGPALAILAASLPSGILFCGLGRLKIKESDRFDGMIRLAQSAGGEVVVKGEDTLHITLLPSSTKLQEPFDSSGDHRLAMAAGIAGLEVQNPSCVSKSFPRFWEEFAACMRS
jgi:3-phosphoshikimate 1-carboxyvinyltransferase